MSSEKMKAPELGGLCPARSDPSQVPADRKATEIGTMPADWQVLSLGEISSFRTGPFGSALHKSDYIEDGIPLVNPKHIVDGVIRPQAGTTISVQSARRLAAYRLRQNDIVIGRRGDIGRCAVIGEPQVGWLCGTGSLIIRCTGAVDASFIQRVLTTEQVIKAITDASVGSTMVNLNQGSLSRLQIQCPRITEQCAIAEVLRNVDELLEVLEAVISKKRAIKQAAMQQLLTGKTRLPGFNGPWEQKRLGDHLTFLRHGVNSRAELSSDGPIRYLHYGDVHTTANVFLDPRINQLPALSASRAKTLDRLQNGDLVLVDASEDLEGVGKSVEIKGVQGEEIISGLHTIAVRFDKTKVADGFKAYLQFCPAFRNHLRRLAAGTKVYATNRAHIASVEIHLPNTEEQTAIATVLSDMDDEITAFEGHVKKTRAIKHGTMQQLLTGRIRLMKPQPAEVDG